MQPPKNPDTDQKSEHPLKRWKSTKTKELAANITKPLHITAHRQNLSTANKIRSAGKNLSVYVWVCVWVWVCMCVRGLCVRATGRVCVWVYVSVCV